jgi:hypothetical protein
MRGQAMKRIVDKLINCGTNFSDLSALEFFAREGDWQTQSYGRLVKSLEAWEIDEVFIPKLKSNLPYAEIKNVDSFHQAKITKNKFDFIVIDNPQNIYGNNNEYCEHFECLLLAARLLNDKGFLIFNINISPFAYDRSPDWKRRREFFYKTPNTSRLDFKSLRKFYEEYLSTESISFEFVDFERRSYYLHYGIYQCQNKIVSF